MGSCAGGDGLTERLEAWLGGMALRTLMWCALALAVGLLWFDLAFRTVLGPVFALPVAFLEHPRQDAGWLAALLAMALGAGVQAVAGRAQAGRGQGGRHRPHEAPRAGRFAQVLAGVDRAALVAALACSAGTALVHVGSQSLPLTLTGGLVGGAGFSVLATRMAQGAPLSRAGAPVLLIACVGLGMAALLRLSLFAFNESVLRLALCALPPCAFVCAELARRSRPVPVTWECGSAAVPSPASPASAASPVPAPSVGQRPRLKSHLTEVVLCFLGLGLYMGIIGFANDNLGPAEFITWQFLTGVLGAFLACALLALSMRANPDGPYVILPVTLGTAALVLLLTTTLMHSDAGQVLAHVTGRATDNLACALAACTMLDLRMAAVGSDVGRGKSSPAVVLATCALALLVGILGGGAFMSTAGLGVVSVALVAVSLVYGALLSLGVSVQQRGRDQFVIVRNPQDMARIAQIQAQALAEELGTLTPRESEVLPYLLQHQSAEAIATQLGISRNTVKTHVAHIYEKAGVNTRAQLVDLAAAKTVSL